MRKASLMCLVFVVTLPCLAQDVGQKQEARKLTGSPGMTSALQSMLTVVDDFPEVEPYIDSTVDWFAKARASLPKMLQSKALSPLKVGGNALPILKANRRKPNKRFQEIGTGLLEDYYDFLEPRYGKTKSGEGLILARRFGVLAGNSTGRPLRWWSDIYELTHDPRALRPLKAFANQIKESAVETKNERGESVAFWWWCPWGKNDPLSNAGMGELHYDQKVWHTGHCHGTAGTVIGLLRAHEVIPDHRFYDGTSVLDLANAGLEWLAAKAIKRERGNGLDWPNVRGTSRTENTGYGAGRGGIGDAFLRGYHANVESDPKRAERYLEIAKLTAVDIVEQLEAGWDYVGRGHVTQFDTFWELNLGWCAGVGGTPRFLFPLADTIKESDPVLAERCIEGCRVVAKWFLDEAIPWKYGGYIWTSIRAKGGPKTVHFGTDVGMCGWVMATHMLATRLDEPELWDMAHGATRAMLSLGDKKGDVITWPHITPICAAKLEEAKDFKKESSASR